MAGLIYVDSIPNFEERGDMVIVTLKSGDDSFEFALTRHALAGMTEAARRSTLKTFEQRPSVIIPFPENNGPETPSPRATRKL